MRKKGVCKPANYDRRKERESGEGGNEVAMAANRMKAGQLCALRLPINNALIKCASGGADGLAWFNCRSIGSARTSWPDQKLAKTNLKQEQNIKLGHAKVFILLQGIERVFTVSFIYNYEDKFTYIL